MKRFLSVLLCLCMVVAMLPAGAVASSTAPVRIKICNMTLEDGDYLESNDATSVSNGYTDGDEYVALYKDGILWLNGIDIVNNESGEEGEEDHAIFWEYSSSNRNDLVIELVEGTVNSIEDKRWSAINGASGWSDVGPSLTIQGKGTLNVTGASYGIWVWKDIVVQQGATVNIVGETKSGISNNCSVGSITIKQGTDVTVSGLEYGVSSDNDAVGDFIVLGGNLTVKGETAAVNKVVSDFGGNFVYVSENSDGTGDTEWDNVSSLTEYKYISLSGYSEEVETYNVDVNSAANGEVEVDFDVSMADETVTITASPDSGYELDTVSVVDEDDNDVNVVGTSNVRKFTMPASSVTVSATFKEIYVAPPADFTALDAAIAEAETIDTDDYTEASVEAMELALEAAKAIDRNLTVDDQDIVDDATAELEDAINNLVALADFAELNAAIAEAGAIVEDNYTTASYAALEAAVADAEAIDQTNEFDQDVVDDAVDAIYAAIEDLVEFKVVEFTAVAVASDVTANYAKADKVYLVFGEPINGQPNLIPSLKVGGEDASAYLSSAGWIENTVFEMDIIADIDNAEIEFVGNESIFAVAGHALKGYSTTIVGNLDEVTNGVAKEMTATIVDNNAEPYMVAGDEIILVFNAPVYNTPAQLQLENNLLADVVAGTYNTVYKITLTDANRDYVQPGDFVKYEDIEAVIKGSYGAAVAPKVIRALVEDVDGTAHTAGDRINVFFSVPTNKVAGTVENAFTGVLAGATGEWIDSQTLVITLGDTEIEINDMIDLSGLEIKDFYGIKDANASNIELEGSFGIAIQPALLTLTAISKAGKGAPMAGDEIYLAFNVKMREDALNLRNDFDFNYGDYGTGASVAWATGEEYEDYSVIIITLGEDANVTPGETKITIEKDLYEETGIKCCEASNLENRIITGTFGTSIAPNLISASIVKRKTAVGAQAGDQIVLLFNVPTNHAEIINLISVSNGSFGNNVEEGQWTNNNTIYTITLGDEASIENGASLTFTNTNGALKDINNQKVASTKTVDLIGSFGEEAEEVGIAPSSVTATIVKTTTVAGAQAGDQIIFAFNVATNSPDLKNYFKLEGVFGDEPEGGWNEAGTVYTLVLGENPTVTDSYIVKFTKSAGIKDVNEVNGEGAEISAGKFIGSFGTTIVPVGIKPTLLGATIVKGDGNTEAYAQAGDQIKFAFNMATNKVDLFDVLGGSALFGTGVQAGGAWNDAGNVYTVTLGEGATIENDTVLAIPESAGLKDSGEYSKAFEKTDIALVGSFGEAITPDGVTPSFISATIVKGDGNTEACAQAGDQIKFAFNMATNKVDLFDVLGGSALFGTGVQAGGAWNDAGNVYTVTLGEGATIENDTVLAIPESAGLKDSGEYSEAFEKTDIALVGSFGEAITPVAPVPELLRAYIVKDTAAHGAQAGDQIVLEFNSSTNAVDLIEHISGAEDLFGEGADGAWSNADTVYTIVLGTGAEIVAGATIEIPATAGLKDATGISDSKAYSTALEGTFGEAIDLHVLGATAYSAIVDGNYVDFIDIEFNVAVQEDIAKTIFEANTQDLFGTGFTAERNTEYDNVITITLDSNNYTIECGSTIEFSQTHKLMSADGKELVNYEVDVVGELRKPMVEKVVAIDDGANGKIQIIFSSKATTDGEIDLSSQSGSLGIGATAEWIDNHTLEITLGTNKTISVGGGYIVLNGMGITNGFDDNEVVGQYFISEGELPEDELRAVDARVSEKDGVAYLTVMFNKATNMDDDIANVICNKGLGTDAAMTWETATKLVITLGADTELKDGKNLVDGATVAFQNIKFANGLGLVVEDAIDINKGSFDGREIRVYGAYDEAAGKYADVITVEEETNYTKATATIVKQDLGYAADAVITFVIWDAAGTFVTDVNAVKIDMTAVDTIEVSSKFAVTDYSKIEVYVTDAELDTLNEDENSTVTILAELNEVAK